MTSLAEQLSQFKLVPVIAVENATDIIPLGQILTEELPIMEITFRSEAAASAIKLLRATQPNMLIGAGTVLTTQQVLSAKEAGADFIVSPGVNPKIVQFCQQISMPIIPGVNNPMAIEASLEMGVNTVKFFPAEASGGVKMLKALLAPYSQLKVMPTGGINLANLKDYLTIPQVLACGGSWFVEKQLIQEKNWQEIKRLTQQALNTIR